MKKFRVPAVIAAGALAIVLAGESAIGGPGGGKGGPQKAQGKVPAQGQAGLTKAGQGAGNGALGLQKAGEVVPAQGQAGLTKAAQGAGNGDQGSQKGKKGGN